MGVRDRLGGHAEGAGGPFAPLRRVRQPGDPHPRPLVVVQHVLRCHDHRHDGVGLRAQPRHVLLLQRGFALAAARPDPPVVEPVVLLVQVHDAGQLPGRVRRRRALRLVGAGQRPEEHGPVVARFALPVLEPVHGLVVLGHPLFEQPEVRHLVAEAGPAADEAAPALGHADPFTGGVHPRSAQPPHRWWWTPAPSPPATAASTGVNGTKADTPGTRGATASCGVSRISTAGSTTSSRGSRTAGLVVLHLLGGLVEQRHRERVHAVQQHDRRPLAPTAAR